MLIRAAQPLLVPQGPSQLDFRKLIWANWREIDDLIALLAEGKITEREWADAFKMTLNRGHMNSWALGRQRAGDFSPLSFADALQGIAAADGDADFLLNFLDALEAGDSRYFDADGVLRQGPVRFRMRLYTGKYRGTANEAFANAAPGEAELWWVLGGNEQHCADCPELAALSPYTKDTMFAKPGSGDTPCLGNCLCHVEIRHEGQVLTGFKPV